MRIDILDSLVKAKHGLDAGAFVAPNSGKRGKVNVHFSHSKCYAYGGSILSVAERLGLIPTIDHHQECRRVYQELITGIQPVYGYGEIIDTLRHVYWYPNQIGTVDCIIHHLDDYDRWVGEFKVSF